MMQRQNAWQLPVPYLMGIQPAPAVATFFTSWEPGGMMRLSAF